MDFDAIQDFFDWVSNELLVGDLDWLAGVFLYPFSLFIDGHIRVVTSTCETKAYLLSRRGDISAIAGMRITAKVLDIGKIRNARFPVNVNYTVHNAANTPIAVNTSRYLCLLDTRHRLRFESVELTRISIPFRERSILSRSP